MSAKDWTDCVQPLFRLCPGAKLLALGEPDAPGDSRRAAEEMWPTPSWSRWRWAGRWPRACCPCRSSYTALLWPLEDAMARLRAEVKNLHLPGCPDPNAEKYQALSLAVEKLRRWNSCWRSGSRMLPGGILSSARMMRRRRRPQSRPRLFGAGTHIYKDAEGFVQPTKRPPSSAGLCQRPGGAVTSGWDLRLVLVRPRHGPAAYRQMLARALAACSVPIGRAERA